MKSALQSVPQSKFNQIMFGGNSSGAVAQASNSSNDENSGVYTPKFQSSNSSTP